MSADLLREAAALMRERAELAAVISGGAWTVHETGYTVIDGTGLDVGTVATLSEAEHIASWHPAVALAVADWLDDAAETDECARRFGGRGLAPSDPALAVARAYLGRADA